MKRTLLFITCILASLVMSAQAYFPEGTKWTEIRLDTLKYDSWYSKVGEEWVPNFETIEYYVKGEYTDNNGKKYKCVYTNGPEWTDSLTLLLQEEGDAEYVGYNTVMVSVLAHDDDGSSHTLWPGEAYQFDWTIGKGLYYKDMLLSNTTSFSQSYCYYGIIDEIKEGNFGGVRPLKYVDLDGKAPDNDPNSPIRNASTSGGRILQGIGITEWNDGECLFGPPNPYGALRMFDSYPEEKYPQRHYRSMLVHFERNGEVLYDVWPEKAQNDNPTVYEYTDPQTNVVYTYQPGQTNASVKAGYEVVIDMGYGYELDIEYHPGSPDAAGDVVILDRFTVGTEEYVVTSIGQAAFRENRHIKSVSIPETVTDIAASAFALCDSLRTVQLPEGLTRIAHGLFGGCSQLVSVDIPSSVSIIDSYAFNSCVSLSSLTLPAGLTRVGRGAFEGTPWYASLYDEAPEGPFYIGSLLLGYKGDKPTGELVIKEGTTYIGYGAFKNCGGLTSVAIPESVTYVDQSAFENCSGLKAVHIKDLAAWCDIEFQQEYQKSSNPLCYAHHLYLNGEVVSDLVIPEGVTSIGSYAFDRCTDLTSVTIPNGVTNIGTYAFRECSNLTSVTIPPSMATIGEEAFIWCFDLNAVHISDLAAWCSISFFYTANPLYYGAHLYLDDKEMNDLIIPEGVTAIGNGTFRNYSRLTTVVIPNSVTEIGEYAFAVCSEMTSVTIGNNVNSIGQWAFSGCQKLMDVYCYAKNAPYTENDVFHNTNIEDATLHVPAASISAYQTVEPWKNFKQIVALSNDTGDSGYMSFVEAGKQWHVSRFTPGHNDMDVVDYYIPQGVEEINGNNYYKMKGILNNTTEIETYLVREENRKVYFFDNDTQKEYLMFDYSLKKGDIYEGYSNESHSMVRFRVVSVDDCTEGPQVREYYYDETADTVAVRYRYLRKWAVAYADFGATLAPRIWIEGIGSLRNPFSGMSDGYYSSDHLTYIIYNGQSDNYLPFSFNEWWNKEWFGCNLPIGGEYENSEDGHHQLTYELEGKRLHVYGKVFCNCGPNHYAYLIEEPRELTDDPLVRKFHFEIQDVEPLMWCEGLHATDFYVEGVNPAYDYYIVDNQGEEHHVINKAPVYVYRPFVEDSKAWVVKVVSDESPTEEWIEYYYFDGDTIVNGQTAKRMLCDRIASSHNISGEYVGAWYEQNKEVYFAANGKQQFEMLYDFTLISNDTMPSPDGSIWIVDKWTGIYPGFKGTCYTFGKERWYEGVGSDSWPFVNHPWGYVGDKGVLLACSVGDEVIYYNTAEDYPYVMGARKRFDFTHTIKTKPKSRMRSGESQSLYGEYDDQQLGINLDPLDDAYLVSITDDTGKVVYEKSINAGNIVGLNIDISAYAKGHYTVIVENSDETFTGEFEAQTTGIRDVRWKKEDRRSIIYNLQGQRLHSLQKGLNIVNGQKVFVK